MTLGSDLDPDAPVPTPKQPSGAEQQLAQHQALFGEAEQALSQNKLPEAVAAFEQALATTTQLDMGPERLVAAVGLGEALLRFGKPAEAAKMIGDAEAWAEANGMLANPNLVRLLLLAAAARADAGGDPQAGWPALDKAKAIADQHHTRDAALLDLVGKARVEGFMRIGKPDAALTEIESQLNRLRSASPPPHLALAEWLDQAGSILGVAQRYAESATRFRESIAARANVASDDPIRAAFTRTNLALSLWRAGQKDDARKELTAARSVLEAKLPTEHQARKRVDQLVVEFGL